MRTIVAILAFIVLLLPFAADARTKVKVEYEYYDVGGRTAEEIRRRMDKHGTKWTDGNTYDAVTRWYVRWHYTYETTSGGFAVASVSTHVDVVIRLPLWNGRDTAPENLRKRWDNYIAALRAHELGHKDFGVDAAAEIERAIAKLEPAGNCETLGNAANALGHRILEKYRQKEIAYDQATRHGFTQGAVFP